MKRKKLLKTLVLALICLTVALSVFTACNTDNGGENTAGDVKLIKPTLSEADEEQPETDEDGYILLKYEFTAHDYEAMTCAEDLVAGIFTVGKGTTIRNRTRTELYNDNKELIKKVNFTKSIQMQNSTATVIINAPETGDFVMYVQDGSGVDDAYLILVEPNGTRTKISYPGKANGSALQEVKIHFGKAGEYKIVREKNTSDIFYMSYTAKVKDSPVASIGVASLGDSGYFVGQKFSIDGLAVNATTETGRISPVDTRRLTIDYTAFNADKAGTYEILVSYTKAGHEYKTSYSVTVYPFEELTLGTDKIIKGKNTSAGNGVYENVSVRQFYFTGEALSTDGLSVILNGSVDGKAQSFILKDTEYNVSDVDMSVAGKKTVTVSYTTGGVTKSKTFEIYVADKDASLATATSVDIVVDPATAAVGVKNGNGAYQFQTIHQALDFLNNSGVSNTARKTINLAAGTYWEKLEVRVPNLTIIGADKATTKIEYDALYGAKDASGFEHVTDSTATLSVREGAENFTVKNVTLSNYYNSVESYTGAPSTDQRALALLVQSDKFTMDNCNLLGYQDTVEFFKGRQFIVNSYIAGTTDFIFGTNNTTYFYNCEIHSVYNGKTDGGYITCFKGCNKDANDAVTYGAIFDKCRFTAAEEVVKNGNTAIGRTWGAYAAVAVINSEIDAHVSLSTNTFGKNERYVSMGGVKPTDSTVKFVEYNNTGSGAIDTAVDGMRFLSEGEAADYSNLAVIFGMTNGKVTYSSAWVPDKIEITK